MLETINDLSGYNHPYLVRYLGLQVLEDEDEKKQVK